jgi:hypothetical protein
VATEGFGNETKFTNREKWVAFSHFLVNCELDRFAEEATDETG